MVAFLQIHQILFFPKLIKDHYLNLIINNSDLELILFTVQVVQEEDDSWYPSSYTAWKLVLSARLCAAVWSGVSDCDETYNYWEPTHNLLYGQGMQTWEYDPR